jgi:hypothetical protein
MSKLSAEWHNLADTYRGKTVLIKDLFEQMGPRGEALLCFVLSLPFLLWVAVPGFSIILGVIILLNGVRMTFRKGMWVPAFLGKKEISGDRLIAIGAKLEKGLKWFEKLTRPRYVLVATNRGFQIFSGLLLTFNGLLLALPLPPGTNFTPALATAFLSLGSLEEDGLFLLLGYGVSLVNCFLYIVLPIIGIRILL